MPDDAAQRVPLFKERDLRPAARKEIRRRHARGAAADHGHPGAAGRAGPERAHKGVKAALGRRELCGADVHRFLIEVARALGHASVAADVPVMKGSGFLAQITSSASRIAAIAHQPEVFGDVLMDGALLGAGCGEAVDEGTSFFILRLGRGLTGLR